MVILQSLIFIAALTRPTCRATVLVRGVDNLTMTGKEQVPDGIQHILLAILHHEASIIHEIYDLDKFCHLLLRIQGPSMRRLRRPTIPCAGFFDLWISQQLSGPDSEDSEASVTMKCMIQFLSQGSGTQIQEVADVVMKAVSPFSEPLLSQRTGPGGVSLLIQEVFTLYPSLELYSSIATLHHPTTPFLFFARLIANASPSAVKVFTEAGLVDTVIRLHELRYSYPLAAPISSPFTLPRMDALCQGVLNALNSGRTVSVSVPPPTPTTARPLSSTTVPIAAFNEWLPRLRGFHHVRPPITTTPKFKFLGPNTELDEPDDEEDDVVSPSPLPRHRLSTIYSESEPESGSEDSGDASSIAESDTGWSDTATVGDPISSSEWDAPTTPTIPFISVNPDGPKVVVYIGADTDGETEETSSYTSWDAELFEVEVGSSAPTVLTYAGRDGDEDSDGGDGDESCSDSSRSSGRTSGSPLIIVRAPPIVVHIDQKPLVTLDSARNRPLPPLPPDAS